MTSFLEKLDERQRAIFRALELNAEKPLSEVAAELGERRHRVRYVYRRLLENHIVSKRIIFDFAALGFESFYVYVSLLAEKPERHKALVEYLLQSSEVAWLQELGGDYQYVVCVVGRDHRDLASFFERASKQFGNVFVGKHISVVHSQEYFGRKYLLNTSLKASLTFGLNRGHCEIDEIDHQILQTLSKNAETSNRALAKQLALSSTTIDQRLRNLRACGIIVASVLTLRQVEAHSQWYRVLVYTRGVQAPFRKKLARFVQQQPRIVSVAETVGSWDFELRIETQAPYQLGEILRDLLQSFSDQIYRARPLPVLRVLKPASYPFQVLPVELRS